jgi:UDP-N-acetylmuramate--alanine ligase
MNLFFSGIGGAGIGPLALIAHQAGYHVSGSDKQHSKYIDYLISKGVTDINVGQSQENISAVNQKTPIDWYIYSSAISIEQPGSEELAFCRNNSIKTSKRDQFLNHLLNEKSLKLIAVAGTHGKSTTTAMLVWLFKELSIPVSYSVGAKISFGEMGEYSPKSEFFIYEADEFDNNFLHFKPFLSLITGVSWDHHEIFPTREEYQGAFKTFLNQSSNALIWSDDITYLGVNTSAKIHALDLEEPRIKDIELAGHYNRLDGFLCVQAAYMITDKSVTDLIEIINRFPGLQRRMEAIVPGLYSDYAHTPEKIRGAMSVALEMAKPNNQSVVVVYEPLTDRRQHYIINDYKDCFEGAKTLYWLPSYLAREDPSQTVLKPEELIKHLSDPSIAKASARDEELIETIKSHLAAGDMVVCMNGGGGSSLDEWLRNNFASH